MKEERKKYEKPQSYAIEMEQQLMTAGSNTVSIGISTEIENKPGRLGVRRYQVEDDWDENEDDWDE